MSAGLAEFEFSPCPKCGGTGWELVEGKGVRPCPCKKAARAEVLLSQARIPQRFFTSTFDNYSTHIPSLTRALMACRRFVEDYPNVDVGLLFLGSCGVGKTHLAVSVLKSLIMKGIPGMFYDFRDLLKEIQDSYNPNTKTSELQILSPIFETEVLVLDELGASKPTEWVQETMTHIINKRYLDKKVTIFTSNYLDMAIGSSYDETLTERVGVRLRSRLKEMCRQILIESDDYRNEISIRRGGRFTS
ncbi:MAG: ATP-binding protein [Acidobacteriota bacterium]